MKPTASVLMMPLSTVYAAITKARVLAYENGLFKVSRLPAPVISVGNITAGGTGKTPLVEWICRMLAQHFENGKQICVLTRGYGRGNPDTQVLVSDGERILANERNAGDEASMLANNLLGIAAVVANADRVAGGNWAIANLGSEIFVLDDGFQHMRIARDLNIVTIDATNPWGGGGLLPNGMLRESPAGLSRADCVVITRTDQVNNVAALQKELQALTGDAAIFRSHMITSGFRTIDGAHLTAKDVTAEPLGAFCGVGNPESFFTHLESDGFKIGLRRAFPDHYRYSQKDLDDLASAAQAVGITRLITTAKDAIKLINLRAPLTCYVLDTQISVDEADSLIAMIAAAITHNAS